MSLFIFIFSEETSVYAASIAASALEGSFPCTP